MDVKPPKIDNAPGLAWKRRNVGWEARWQARTDLVERGFPIKSHGVRMWAGEELTPAEVAVSNTSSRRRPTATSA